MQAVPSRSVRRPPWLRGAELCLLLAPLGDLAPAGGAVLAGGGL